MTEKRLIYNVLEEDDGAVCALGALRKAKGVALEPLRNADWCELGEVFDVTPILVREVMFENDDGHYTYGNETHEQRWVRMRDWAASLCGAETRGGR